MDLKINQTAMEIEPSSPNRKVELKMMFVFKKKMVKYKLCTNLKSGIAFISLLPGFAEMKKIFWLINIIEVLVSCAIIL